MAEYLRKRALYKLAQSLVDYELPKCKEMDYDAYEGAEWLKDNWIKITCLGCGSWIGVDRNYYDESVDELATEREIFSTPRNGEYLFHSKNGEILRIENTEGQNYEQSNSNRKSEGRSKQDNYDSEFRRRSCQTRKKGFGH